MATIYLSSTYNDLKAFREAVYRALRKMRHDVIAMEDYVATDQRPLEKCLADVATSDLYIGIFAWRYGYIPPNTNSEHKSVTELEYRRAIEAGKACLLFLLDKDAPWPSTAMDAITGEGNRGELIAELRRELSQKKVISYFQTPEELASLVSTAVNNWEKNRISVDTSNASPSFSLDQIETLKRKEHLKSLIINHSGFMRSRLENFVGRGQELAYIRRQINAMLPTGGYITITGQAGQGKTSIIARLVQEYPSEQVVYHFIPFKPGPDHQVSLLRDIMARLILKHQLDNLYFVSETRPALRDFFPKVLAEIASKGKQEVIFIDGIDQLREDQDGERDLSFLPDNPPEGIVFVLGTRPNDTLFPLQLKKPHQQYALPNFSRNDFALLLEHRQVYLQQATADIFYQAMRQNALYLDLVAKELSQKGAANPEEIIRRVADDPDNIFSLSIRRLKRQAIEWREVLKPILGLLLVAREPLTVRHIRQILSLDDERVREGMIRLGGLIADDGQYRFSLFHLKLYDYLRQDELKPYKEYVFAKDEVESWHQQLVDWCERGGINTVWEDVQHDSVEQGRREYARKHYITHLYFAHQWKQLFDMLDEGNYGKAKLQYDLTARLYAQDLDVGRQASASKEWILAEGVEHLSYLWRYTLLRCSLASRADQYPVEAFRALVLLKQKRKALDLAELLTNPATQISALLLIAEQLRMQGDQERSWQELLMRANEVARSIEDPGRRSEALGKLTTALVQAREWRQAEAVIGTIEQFTERAKASSMLAAALAQAGQWRQAEAVIDTIRQPYWRARASGQLAAALAQAGQWRQAEAVIDTIGYLFWRSEALGQLAAALAQARQWSQAEVVIGKIKDPSSRGEALTKLAAALAHSGQSQQAKELWQQAEAVIGMIEDLGSRGEALSKLATALAQAGQLQQAQELWQQAQVLFDTIIWHPFWQAEVMRKLATTLAGAGQLQHAQELWQQTEVIIGGIEHFVERAEALSRLVTALAQAGQLQYAEEMIERIEDPNSRVEASSRLATALAQAGQSQQAEMVIAGIEDLKSRAEKLIKLATELAYSGQSEQADALRKRAEVMISRIEILRGREESLKELTTALAQTGQSEQAQILRQRAEAIIDKIEDPSSRAEAMSRLATALVQAGQLQQAREIWQQAEVVIGMIEDFAERVESSSRLATALAQAGQWHEAGVVIGRMEDPSSRAEALSKLATALEKTGQCQQARDLWQRAEMVIGTIEDFSNRVEALRIIAADMADAGTYEQLLRLVQHCWLQASTRDYAIELLQLANGLLPLRPSLGMIFYEAFSWVDSFLSSVTVLSIS